MPGKLDAYLAIAKDALAHEFGVGEKLTTRAEKYLSAIGLIATLHSVDFPAFATLPSNARWVLIGLFTIGAVGLLVAIPLAVDSMRVQRHATYPTTDELRQIKTTAASDDAVVAVIADVSLEIRDRIRQINETRAAKLKLAGSLITIGFLMTLGAQLGVKLQ